jgi:FdhD protein
VTLGARSASRWRWTESGWSRGSRVVPEESPVAFVVDGDAAGVMMATPCDLEDFALGFALDEGLLTRGDVLGGHGPFGHIGLDVLESELGIELHLSRPPGSPTPRARTLTGPSSCGLCGTAALADLQRPLPRVDSTLRVELKALVGAMSALADRQPLGAATRAVHAAALWLPGDGIVLVREDVGRHNALDKLSGAILRRERAEGRAESDPSLASRGVILLTSRLSVELVEKAAMMGAGVIAAISAPTALALGRADACGITLLAVVRPDGGEVFTHPGRIAELDEHAGDQE